MRIDLTSAVFEPAVPDHIRWTLFGFAFEERHNVVVLDEAQQAYTKWLRALPQDAREEVELAVQASLDNEGLEAHAMVIVVGAQDDFSCNPCVVSPETARNLASEPLRLLLENSRSDRALLEAVVPPEYAAPFERLTQRDWLRFEHGGGSELARIVDAGVQNPCWVIRTFVLFDSDAIDPGTISEKAQALVDKCRVSGLACHCLSRRECENYLPKNAIQNWGLNPKKRNWKRAEIWIGFSDDMRHHFDMKDGFRGSNSQSLFSNVSETDRETLSRGFGSDIWKQFEYVSPDWIDRDGQRPELLALFGAILRMR